MARIGVYIGACMRLRVNIGIYIDESRVNIGVLLNTPESWPPRLHPEGMRRLPSAAPPAPGTASRVRPPLVPMVYTRCISCIQGAYTVYIRYI